ncbi:UNVERIFIED_CONTAM: hypothetical protein NCL1_54448 [Trichonephila clavipes]
MDRKRLAWRNPSELELLESIQANPCDAFKFNWTRVGAMSVLSSLDCSARHVCYFSSTHQSHFSRVIGSNTHDLMAPPTSCLKV